MIGARGAKAIADADLAKIYQDPAFLQSKTLDKIKSGLGTQALGVVCHRVVDAARRTSCPQVFGIDPSYADR